MGEFGWEDHFVTRSPIQWNTHPEWYPKNGEKYYYVNSACHVYIGMWHEGMSNVDLILCGNIFKKEEDASRFRDAIARLARRMGMRKP